ncbi:MAG: enoyl-CoA hydratase [Thiotrichales bacterium]|nr:MAG: enoyl-CoA hydratase [Thiotrichales bacterium]
MNNIVQLTRPEPGIAVVQLQDRAHQNTFSSELIQGLQDTFAEIGQDNTIKVVVIYGYDSYFCCGGTKEELLNIFSGKLSFDELAFYRLLLDCEVPTIAAMQGHGIGGGLAFGCYADLIIMAREAIYSTNFMKYGFTPGMGATYMVPRKFGEIIGHELLYSADTYHGGVLKEKGIPIPVLPKAEVIPHAMALARQLADKPRTSLKILKAHLTQDIKRDLPQIIEDELKLHEVSFAQPEVKQRIERLFGQ